MSLISRDIKLFLTLGNRYFLHPVLNLFTTDMHVSLLTQKRDFASVATFVHLTTVTTLSSSMMSICRAWFRFHPRLSCPPPACPCPRSLSHPLLLGCLRCHPTASHHHRVSSPWLVSTTTTSVHWWQLIYETTCVWCELLHFYLHFAECKSACWMQLVVVGVFLVLVCTLDLFLLHVC